MTPSSSRGIEFYSHCALVVIGVVGTATNALILYALVASKQQKKHVLIFNQNVLDLFTCIFIVISYSSKLCNIHLTGSVGYWLCILLHSDCLIWCGTNGSVINLASITVERYLIVVHPVWSKKKLHNWMIYSTVAISWIAGFIRTPPLVFSTTAVIDGVCYAYTIWASDTARIIEFIYSFLSFYVIILLIFIFCYWRILIVIRRRARLMASHAAAAGPSTAQTQYNQMQSSVTKTMIYVCAFYAIAWLPTYMYALNMTVNPNPTISHSAYFSSIFIAFLYTCTNPFVYAAKFDPVREVLLRLIRYKKTSEEATENLANFETGHQHELLQCERQQ